MIWVKPQKITKPFNINVISFRPICEEERAIKENERLLRLSQAVTTSKYKFSFQPADVRLRDLETLSSERRNFAFDVSRSQEKRFNLDSLKCKFNELLILQLWTIKWTTNEC